MMRMMKIKMMTTVATTANIYQVFNVYQALFSVERLIFLCIEDDETMRIVYF